MRAERISTRPSSSRFVTRTPGIVSRHSFSFGEHYDPDDVGYGPLLVSNEDTVEFGAGYDTHPHRDAEIVTWVLSGSLVHEDSYGNSGLVYPGLAARMSAGSGIVHAERNDAFRVDPHRAPEPVHFVQMWLRPDLPDATPGYAQRELDLRDLDRGWVPVASGGAGEAAISLGTRSATLLVTRFGPGASRVLPDAPRLYVHLARGDVELEGAGRLAAGDTARITGGGGQRVTGHTAAELLVWALDA